MGQGLLGKGRMFWRRWGQYRLSRGPPPLGRSRIWFAFVLRPFGDSGVLGLAQGFPFMVYRADSHCF